MRTSRKRKTAAAPAAAPAAAAASVAVTAAVAVAIVPFPLLSSARVISLARACDLGLLLSLLLWFLSRERPSKCSSCISSGNSSSSGSSPLPTLPPEQFRGVPRAVRLVLCIFLFLKGGPPAVEHAINSFVLLGFVRTGGSRLAAFI